MTRKIGWKGLVLVILLVVILPTSLATAKYATEENVVTKESVVATTGDSGGAIYRGVSTAVQFDVSPPLRDLAPADFNRPAAADACRPVPGSAAGRTGCSP